MKRVFEFVPTDHEIVVSRTLLMVHRAIDNHFPNANPASGKYAKTSFGGDDNTVTKTKPEWTATNPDAPTLKEKNNTEETMIRGVMDEQRLWKQSLIAILTIAICAIFAYLIISLKVD